jgi:hypothetical protein
MGEVIYGVFTAPHDTRDKIISAKQRTLLNADWLWKLKGWTYQLPATNLPKRWEKEIAGVVVWAYILELNGRYGRYTFERRSDAHDRRLLKAVSKRSDVGCPHAD